MRESQALQETDDAKQINVFIFRIFWCEHFHTKQNNNSLLYEFHTMQGQHCFQRFHPASPLFIPVGKEECEWCYKLVYDTFS